MAHHAVSRHDATDTDRHNWYRFSVLALDVMPAVLRNVFRRKWMVKYGTSWEDGPDYGRLLVYGGVIPSAGDVNLPGEFSLRVGSKEIHTSEDVSEVRLSTLTPRPPPPAPPAPRCARAPLRNATSAHARKAPGPKPRSRRHHARICCAPPVSLFPGSSRSCLTTPLFFTRRTFSPTSSHSSSPRAPFCRLARTQCSQ